MTDAATPLTITAHRPEPYVHLDNRGLVICNGLRCVLIPAANLRWAAETFALIADEQRATRAQGNHVVGGFVGDEGGIVLFAGTRDDIISVGIERPRLRAPAPRARRPVARHDDGARSSPRRRCRGPQHHAPPEAVSDLRPPALRRIAVEARVWTCASSRSR